MDFIRNSLVDLLGSTIATYSGRGGELYDTESESWKSVGKERVKREFSRDDGQVDILVCTDSASEGLNLQECGALINYDLPWNPMRVEQRIGRIDRIGQRFDEVRILNYSYEDTVETDIYDRLDDRIGLFENVVGEMQPILSGVSSQIRNATLNADRDDSQQVIEEADREFSEQIEEQEQGGRVDVGESLDSVDSLVEQDVINEAKLDAWQSYGHPDISEVGENKYAFSVPYRSESLQAVLVQNPALDELDIGFMSTSEFDIDLNDGDDKFAFEESTYRLSVGPTIDAPEPTGEQTLAYAIAPDEDEIAVTFSAECADVYPSIQYLAPGNPLLDQLINKIRDASEESERLFQQIELRTRGADLPVVCGWGRNRTLGRIGDDGTVSEDQEASVLREWCTTFLENREQTRLS